MRAVAAVLGMATTFVAGALSVVRVVCGVAADAITDRACAHGNRSDCHEQVQS